MKALLAAATLACLSACSHRTRTVLIDVSRPASTRADDARAEKDVLADIKDRIRTGRLPNIQFESNSTAITSDSFPTLDAIARVLKSDDRLKIVIQAYSDDAGDADYNRDLSELRAKEVKAYLARQGVAPPSMRFRGYGEARPVADNSTEEGRAKNRRVEFRVTTREWNAVY